MCKLSYPFKCQVGLGTVWYPNLVIQLSSAPSLQLQYSLSAMLHCRGIKIAIDLKNSTPDDGKLRAFHRHLKANKGRTDIVQLKEEVEAFATEFPMPGL